MIGIGIDIEWGLKLESGLMTLIIHYLYIRITLKVLIRMGLRITMKSRIRSFVSIYQGALLKNTHSKSKLFLFLDNGLNNYILHPKNCHLCMLGLSVTTI